MNIIFITGKMAKARSLNFWQSTLAMLALALVPVILTLYFITPKQSIQQQGVKALMPKQLKTSIVSSQAHLDAYAKEIGELQARIMRLDAQNQRLAKLVGVDGKLDTSANKNLNQKKLQPLTLDKETENKTGQVDKSNSGGPLVNEHAMSENELKLAIADLASEIDLREDMASSLEAKVLQQSVYKDMLPTGKPINAGYNSSSYGWRIDPFNGHKAFHEGLDFTAQMGIPIKAAGDGIVIMAERTHDYGNLVKVDHGSGLETRYAHASKLLVHVGERVSKGQVLAEVGSTGRSTGPHLHYEIRLHGSALDPRKYLTTIN